MVSSQKILRLGTTADGRVAWLDYSHTNVEYHLLETPNLIELVQEAIPGIGVTDQEEVISEYEFGRVVGTTNLVETTSEDEIVYAKRKGRDTISRFVKNKQPTPCSSIVVVLRKGELGYYLWTAMCAKLLPDDAWDPTSEFSQTHAIVYDENLVQLDTVTVSRPL